MNTKPKGAGFTLIELLMVIGVIVILAGILIFNFTKAKERALTKEAIANLKLIAAAEKVYRMENSGYYPAAPASEGDIADINNDLKLYFTNETNWDYTIATVTADDFTATALRTGGPYSTCKYEIKQDTTGEPTKAAGATCP